MKAKDKTEERISLEALLTEMYKSTSELADGL